MTHLSVFSKIKAIAVLLLLGLTFGACTKHVTQVVDQNFSTVYKIQPTDWLVDSSQLNSYYVNMNVPEVDDAIFNRGGVVVYGGFVLDNSGNPTVWDALPEVVNGVPYNVYHTQGDVTIGIGDPTHGAAATKPTSNIFFKVVIMDASSLD